MYFELNLQTISTTKSKTNLLKITMKKYLLSVVLLTYGVITFGQTSVSKNVLAAGTLTFTPTELSTVTDLTLKGTIDSRDFLKIGALTSLQNLDLSQVSIAAYTGTLGTGGTTSQTYPANTIPYMAFQNAANKAVITSIVLPNNLTSIGSFAFDQCSNLTTVTFGTQISSIEANAFFNCTSLSSIDLKQNSLDIKEYAFANCSNLQTANLGDVLSLEKSAFTNCSKLTTLNLGNSLKSIADFCFLNCTMLSISQLPNSLITIGSNVFQGDNKITSLSIGSNLTSINNIAFQYMDGLTSITVDNSNQNFTSENGVLMNKAKTSIVFYPTQKSGSSFITPNSITSINDYAFFGCKNLTDIVFSQNITSIGNYAFSGCVNLNKLILLPSNPPTLGVQAFGGKSIPNVYTSSSALSLYKANTAWNPMGISSFQVIDVINTTPGGLKVAIKNKYPTVRFETINSLKVTGTLNSNDLIDIATFSSLIELDLSAVTTFADGVLPSNMFKNSSTISTVILPIGIKKIGDYAFSNCVNLNSITNFPVDSIGNYAFSNCNNLKINNLVLSSKMSFIGNNAFQNCTSVQGSIVIPDSILAINDSTFFGCTGINGHIIFNNKIKTIGKSAFEGDLKITNISFKSSTTEIKDNAFKGCIGINIIDVENNTPPTIYQNTFSSVDKINTLLNISTGTTTLYKANQYWKEFTLLNESSGVSTVDIMISCGVGGKVTINGIDYVNGSKATINKTDNLVIDILPDSDKDLSLVMFGNVNITDRFWTGNYSGWGQVSSNTPLTIAFKPKQIPLSIKQITGEVIHSVDYGASPEITISSYPANGWTISSISLNGTPLTISANNKYKIDPIIKSSIISIVYKSTALVESVKDLVKVYTSDTEIFVEGTESGEEIKLYNVNGIQLQSVISTGERVVIPVYQTGVYLVKTANATYKVVL
jgi:BspA type Leucine rich repeat region (6 copies)